MARSAWPFESKHALIHGMRLHYVEHGSGPPALFLHGNPTWSYLWRNVLPEVGRTHRAIAVDLAGFGRSEHPRGFNYDFDEHAALLAGFIDHLELDDLSLLLHDWGGILGMHWAVEHLDRVSRVALLSTFIVPVDGVVRSVLMRPTLPDARRCTPHRKAPETKTGRADDQRAQRRSGRHGRGGALPRPHRQPRMDPRGAARVRHPPPQGHRPRLTWEGRHFHICEIHPQDRDLPRLFQIELDGIAIGAVDFVPLPADRTLMRVYLCSDLGAACVLDEGDTVLQGFASHWLSRLAGLGFLAVPAEEFDPSSRQPLGFRAVARQD